MINEDFYLPLYLPLWMRVSFFVYCLSAGLGLSAADKEVVYRLDTMAPSV